jgi:hypothetical protein
LEDFDESRFTRFLNISGTSNFRHQQCSEVNIDFGLFAVNLLSELWDTTDPDTLSDDAQLLFKLDIDSEALGKILSSVYPESCCIEKNNVESIDPMQNREERRIYPTSEELFTVVNELDSSISSKSSFSTNVLSELQSVGLVKQAYCPTRPNGKRWVYYPHYLPDPDDALWVKSEGEKDIVG